MRCIGLAAQSLFRISGHPEIFTAITIIIIIITEMSSMEALLSGYAILKTAGDFETLSLSCSSPSQVQARIQHLFLDFILFMFSGFHSCLHDDVTTVVNRKINCLVCNIFYYQSLEHYYRCGSLHLLKDMQHPPLFINFLRGLRPLFPYT